MLTNARSRFKTPQSESIHLLIYIASDHQSKELIIKCKKIKCIMNVIDDETHWRCGAGTPPPTAMGRLLDGDRLPVCLRVVTDNNNNNNNNGDDDDDDDNPALCLAPGSRMDDEHLAWCNERAYLDWSLSSSSKDGSSLHLGGSGNNNVFYKLCPGKRSDQLPSGTAGNPMDAFLPTHKNNNNKWCQWDDSLQRWTDIAASVVGLDPCPRTNVLLLLRSSSSFCPDDCKRETQPRGDPISLFTLFPLLSL